MPIEDLATAPKGRYISGLGKRKLKKRHTALILTSTPNMNAKNEPKTPPEKSRRNVTKTLFEED